MFAKNAVSPSAGGLRGGALVIGGRRWYNRIMDERDIHIIIKRSARRTLALEILPDGSVLVRAPYRLSERYIRGFLAAKGDWIEEHRRRMARRQAALAGVRPLTEGELAELRQAAARDLPARCARLAPVVGVRYGRITIRRQRTRWGSCSAGGNLNFNCLLMLAPEPVREYVAVHELCHRKYMDHSPLFWAEVERVLPDWRERRRWLRENGGALLARLDGGDIQ